MVKTQSDSASDTFTWTYYLAPAYVGWRIWWANRMPIMDCDEVFNYWEPLHFLLYGTGFQTWEYAHDFALRPYAYLLPLMAISKVYQRLIPYLPAWIWPLLTANQNVLVLAPTITDTLASAAPEKIPLFLLLRATLAGTMAFAEVSFCRAISQNGGHRASLVGLTTGGLMLASAGMSHAAGAFLPSSTLVFLWLLASAAFLRQQNLRFAFFAVMATLAIGWPFGVLMFVPIGLVVTWRERSYLVSFLGKVLFLTACIQGAVLVIDREQYGKWVSPTWNILMYNAKGGGDELYGIEPPSYYVKNLALNFNYVAAAAILALPVVVMMRRDVPSLLVILLPMYAWLGVVFPRPHKEERFMFPIYPALCLGAALLSVTIVDSTNRWISNTAMRDSSALLIQVFLWMPAVAISFSRTLALSHYYTAPLQVYSQFHHHPDAADSVLCTCGEWYRFPSSFYLPPTIRSFGLVESSFKGQLPQLFLNSGSRPNKSQFNDQNRPEPGSYTLIEDCDFLVDLLSSSDCRENDSIWKPIALGAFLNAERTTSTLHRTLYVPWWHEQEELRGSVEYDDYILYQRLEEI